MNNKTIEILIQLLGHLKEKDFDMDSFNEMSESLIVSGYNENDVAEALGWLLEKLNFLHTKSTDIVQHGDNSIRILSDYERLRISTDVYGYLLKLRGLSIIDGIQMEKIIDYCMLFGAQKISVSDVNEVIAAVFFEDQGNDTKEI